MKGNKKGFTLVELLAVIVILAVIILIAVTAVIPRMNSAKKNALVDEALVYLKAAKEAYEFDPNLYNSSSCTSISDLNGKYVKKDDDKYKGSIKTVVNDGVISQTIYLTDGKFYVSGSDNITIDNVTDEKPAGFLNSCGDFNPILAGNVDTNSLGYKLLMNEGGSTLNENLSIIEEKTSNINYATSSYDSTNSGIHKAEDDDGGSFYYRGDVNNNWLEFGGFYWRILRINGDGSIRIIYSGLKNSTHAGDDVLINNSQNQKVSQYSTEASSIKLVDDVSGLSSEKIQTTYSPLPYMGYMYDTNRTIQLMAYPQDFSTDNPIDYSNFNFVSNIYQNTELYLFKNFDPDLDCTTSGEQISCTLKCRSLGTDCIKEKWGTVSTTEGNYIASASDYSASWMSVYTGPFRYICDAPTNNFVTHLNSDGTTSVYVSCTSVNEIILFMNGGSLLSTRNFRYNHKPSTDSQSKVKDSNLKKEIDTWYASNILNVKDSLNNDLEEYLSDNIFCNDMTVYNQFNGQYYDVVYRVDRNPRRPTFKCSNRKNDGYTLGSKSQSTVQLSNKGNGMLKYPAATVTADELFFACVRNNTSSNCYFNSSSPFWIMSPTSLNGQVANDINYGTNGFIYRVNISSSKAKLDSNRTVQTSGIRPVINLKASVLYDSGSGTEADPYKIKLPTT